MLILKNHRYLMYIWYLFVPINYILKREIIQTGDGSTTIQIAEWNECYHSKHGAIQEAYHVFIKNGLSLFPN